MRGDLILLTTEVSTATVAALREEALMSAVRRALCFLI